MIKIMQKTVVFVGEFNLLINCCLLAPRVINVAENIEILESTVINAHHRCVSLAI